LPTPGRTAPWKDVHLSKELVVSRILGRLSRAAKRNQQTVRLLAPVVARAKELPLVGGSIRRALRFSGTGTFDPAGYVRLTDADVAEGVPVHAVNLIRYATHSGSAYSGQQYPAGYHSLRVDGVVLEGQRDPEARLEILTSFIPDLSQMGVLDIGSNQGGMCFAALDRGARWTVGVDYDANMVNAANRVAADRGDLGSARFFVFDADRDPLDLLKDFVPDQNIDIIFLLAVCAWIDRWEELITWASRASEMLLFESNGSSEQQSRQCARLRACYAEVIRLSAASSDDGDIPRSLYLCRGPRR
jgi:hypothetical protein